MAQLRAGLVWATPLTRLRTLEDFFSTLVWHFYVLAVEYFQYRLADFFVTILQSHAFHHSFFTAKKVWLCGGKLARLVYPS